jgi:hypothetical protein
LPLRMSAETGSHFSGTCAMNCERHHDMRRQVQAAFPCDPPNSMQRAARSLIRDR